MSPRSTLVAAFLLLAITAPAQRARACSEVSWTPPDFVLATGPEDLDAFAAGDLGIVLPSFARSYLVVAYRAISGRPLTETERQGAIRVWSQRLGRGYLAEPEGLDVWRRARTEVCGIDGQYGTVKSQMVEDPETASLCYVSFENCYSDAFETAAARLEELVARHGPAAPQTLDWLVAQDAVFRNCSGRELSVPPPVSVGSREQRTDRDYQLAAAWFYSGDFDMAEAAFRAIARDRTSRWHTLAPYLVVRCLVRRADIDWKERDAYLSQALVEIDVFLQDSAVAALHAAASWLRGIILKRLDPDRRTPELAELIGTGQREDEFAENLWDLTQLLDLYHSSPGRARQDAILRQDLIAWLQAFQSGRSAGPEGLVRMWRQNRSLPWLVAALAHVHGDDVGASELLEAAGQLDPHAPA